jgi:hypothetical protein
VLVGLFAGGLLGPLFAPDPTGLTAAGLAVLVAAAVVVGLRRADRLRDRSTGT